MDIWILSLLTKPIHILVQAWFNVHKFEIAIGHGLIKDAFQLLL